MDLIDEFEGLLDQNIKKRIATQVQWVIISAVDWENKTCEAKGLHDDLDFHEVHLGLGSVNFKPKVNSKALIGLIENNSAKPYLILAEDLESIEFKTGETELKITNGFLLRKENETLKALMADLIAAIKRMKFTTNTGSTIKLINEPEFTALEKRFNNLLR
ncbi:hypothetical protein EDL98_09955 [Ornithobacterium rhinotracheale]|uniref:hypothetical protein n=1 Tax=Ornithobacterium rhinotracheale TaxID=28251 RepID=UPI00129C9E6C|nr:hypothetical protein [Ornithobacterium rhinotracheale]MRJ11390.1 hypothetical protein [Ornithobacterium rhinotracheale]